MGTRPLAYTPAVTLLRRLSTILVAAGALGAGPAPCAFAQSGVDVEIDQFGFGISRPGGIVPMRLKLTSNLAQPTPVWVQWQVPNADGDIGEYGRSLSLSPGQPALVWLYAPLQPNDNLSTVWTVRVFEERDGQRRGELGGRRISPADAQAQMARLDAGMIAVIGDRRLELDNYSALGNQSPRPISGHEDTNVVATLKPGQVPDRWYGLTGFEALAWAGDSAPPQDLGLDQADAIREWVQRGGHLIISLPAAGNPWGLGAAGQTQLEDMLPCRTVGVTPRRDESVPLSALLPIMCKTQNVTHLINNRKEPEFGIRVFKDLKGDFNVIDNGFEPLIALPDGRVVVVQKRVGFGRVTVIGIDLADGRLGSVGLPQADVFWNRVLGRRADTPTITELTAAEKAEKTGRWGRENDRNMGSGGLFASGINMQTTAGAGLLLALLLFVVYWLAALASFFVLRQYKLARHSWIAFAACAGAFTVVAWGSIGLIPKSQSVQHLTILDHIARPPNAPGAASEEQNQRAFSFFSLYLPHYGATEVSIKGLPEHRDLLECWTPPGESITPFPNTDTFRVDVARNFADYRLPSRSTTTQLYANWLGGVDPKWGGLLRVDPNNPLRVVKDGGGGERSLAGSVISELPATLKDVVIVWIKSNRAGNRHYARDNTGEKQWVSLSESGGMLSTGEMYGLVASSWESGATLDFANLEGKGSPLTTSINAKFMQPYEDNSMMPVAASQNMSASEQRRLLLMMSMFHQLKPPEYLHDRNDTSDRGTATFHRELGRELDLSAWFTRPCVIVMGFLEDVPSPIPLRLGGSDDAPSSTGMVMVRWIYPLPLDESVAFKVGEGGEQ